jgi:hypothetical protein
MTRWWRNDDGRAGEPMDHLSCRLSRRRRLQKLTRAAPRGSRSSGPEIGFWPCRTGDEIGPRADTVSANAY